MDLNPWLFVGLAFRLVVGDIWEGFWLVLFWFLLDSLMLAMVLNLSMTSSFVISWAVFICLDRVLMIDFITLLSIDLYVERLFWRKFLQYFCMFFLSDFFFRG